MRIITDGCLPDIPEPLPSCPPSDIALAVDVGTTTVAVAAWSLSERRILAVVAERNAQHVFGADVISRIDCAVRGSFGKIRALILSQLSRMFSSALFSSSRELPRGFRPAVRRIAVTGNTTMMSFLAGFPVDGLSAVPFRPASQFGFEIPWGDLCAAVPSVNSAVSKNVPVYFPPVVGAFVGADTVCAMVASSFSLSSEKPVLLADVGTNSELVLLVPKTEKTPAKILCTAAAAGPAFEAANISSGMPSVDGAVDKVSVVGGVFSARVIGGKNALGLCGSGLVSAVSAFLECGAVGEDGAIAGGGPIEICGGVFVSQEDIRNFQLAKSAVATGIGFLLSRLPDGLPQAEFIIAGGFGSRIDVGEAVRTGLFPKKICESALQVGNAALFGASALLFSDSLRKKADELRASSFLVNLAAIPGFQEKFLGNISLREMR